jgi:hypothetical protein
VNGWAIAAGAAIVGVAVLREAIRWRGRRWRGTGPRGTGTGHPAADADADGTVAPDPDRPAGPG